MGSPTFDEVPHIDQTRYSPNVSQQLMATADREWVMYTITDELEHVASAPCVCVHAKHMSYNNNNTHMTAERVLPPRTYKDLRSLLSPFS